jgi:hypothetical protein
MSVFLGSREITGLAQTFPGEKTLKNKDYYKHKILFKKLDPNVPWGMGVEDYLCKQKQMFPGEGLFKLFVQTETGPGAQSRSIDSTGRL